MKRYYIIITIFVVIITLSILIFHNEDNRSEIKIKTKSGIINMETYMCNVIINEMKDYDNIEAIKAFSVIIRSNLISTVIDRDKEIINNEDIKLNYNDKLNIKGKEYRYLKDKIMNAINKTKGEVLIYKDKIIKLPYHKISSGITYNIIKGTDIEIPYLQNTVCEEDRESEEYLKIKYISSENNSMEDKINKELEDISSNFYIEKIENRIRVVLQGNGHGYGMSLYNANEMAKKGSTYKDILFKFYKNIKLVRVY